MKVTVIIELDMDTGDYELQILNSEKQKTDQKKLSLLMYRVIKNWSQKFVN
jgi:hypothetical protein